LQKVLLNFCSSCLLQKVLMHLSWLAGRDCSLSSQKCCCHCSLQNA
jgi:hypothetical protein